MKGSNDKMILLCEISVFDRIKGIIGHNAELIRRSSGCSYDYLVYDRGTRIDSASVSRAEAVKELTACLEGGVRCDNFCHDEIKVLINCISCY